jgi:hypothetical protein
MAALDVYHHFGYRRYELVPLSQVLGTHWGLPMSLSPCLRTVCLSLLCALTIGCGTARFVAQGPNGGIVAIPKDTDANRAAAAELMATHCPQGYVIDNEQVVSLADRSESNPRIGPFLNRGAQPSQEYRITFHGK